MNHASFTVVAEYLKQWREEKALAKESDMEISQELQQAILAEYALVANKVKQGLEGVAWKKWLGYLH